MTTSQNRRRRTLLVITHLYAPDSCGGAPMFTDMCEGLAARGIDVTVRCAYPYYPEWKDKSGHNGVRVERFTHDGVAVERYGLFIPRNPNSVAQRLFYEASYFFSITRSLFRGGPFDAVMVFCPLAGSVAFAGLHKLVHRRPLWLSVQDLPADAAAAGGIAGGRGLKSILGFVQKLLFNAGDVWSTISPVMAERLEALRWRRQPVLLSPNWLHASLADAIVNAPPRSPRQAGDPIRLFYSGNVGSKQGLLDFCRRLAVSDAPFSLRVHAAGGGAAELQQWINTSGDSRFSFGELLDEAGFVANLRAADMFLVTERAGSGASFFPSKMIPSLASGTPILAVSDPASPLGREMNKYDVGPRFDWDECDGVPSLLTSLASDSSSLERWRENGLARSRSFDRNVCLDRIEQRLEDLIAGVPESRQAPVVNAEVTAAQSH